MNSLFIASAVIVLTLFVLVLDALVLYKSLRKVPEDRGQQNANGLLKRYIEFKKQGDIHSIVQWQDEVHQHLQQLDEHPSTTHRSISTKHNVLRFPARGKT